MSLINDALKRAKQAHEQKEQPSLRGAPLHTLPPTPVKKNLTPVIIAGVALVILLLGGGFVALRMKNTPPALKTAGTTAVQTIQPTGHATPPAPQPIAVEPQPAPVVVVPEPVAPAPAVTPAAAPTLPAVIPPPPAPAFPEVRLQGILYQPGRPAAIINGRTLFIGGRVADVTVVAITPENATVTWLGQTNILTLPQ